MQVDWSFLIGIAVTKAIIFLTVFMTEYFLNVPRQLSRPSIFAILCTQTNDFGMGLPILESVYGTTHKEQRANSLNVFILQCKHFYKTANLSLFFLKIRLTLGWVPDGVTLGTPPPPPSAQKLYRKQNTYLQVSIGIRQWSINWCTSLVMIHKINPHID